jgi:hypothetical protein
MIKRLILAVCVAVVVTLVLTLVGSVLATLEVAVAVSVGTWLEHYSAILGVVAGIFYFFNGSLGL